MSQRAGTTSRRVPPDAVVAWFIGVLLVLHVTAFDGLLLAGPIIPVDLGDAVGISMQIHVVPVVGLVAFCWFLGRAAARPR